MMTSFQAVVSDLDGTLLNADHTISQFTIETLNKLAHNGTDIFFATGRNYPDVKHIINKINVDQAMLITSNGARANFLSGQQIFSHHLAEDLAEKLMNIPFDNSRVCINTYQGDEWFISTDIAQLKKYHQDSGFCYQVVDFQQHHPRQTEKIFFIAKTVEDLLPIEQY
ncbi:haloacid dehalogenase-like hydrolase [[Haemophilus] ducreyi]|nr:haloacid dehalogenase-like hydrolase [[Haemophilus] ducreyi]